MFTGIVDHCGEVVDIKQSSTGVDLQIKCQFSDLHIGESIAMDGACITVIEPQRQLFTCNLSPETLKLTQASQLRLGSKINLERALRLSDRLDGHIVTGHVDTCCKLAKKIPHDNYTEFNFSGISRNHMAFLVEKGSVAINGVSLTINDVFDDGFSLMLIPHTLEITNLVSLEEGQLVNIEFDYLAKLINKRVQQQVDLA